MPKMVYTVVDFDNPQVREAANPSTIRGWHYNPVPYTNTDWTSPEGTITPKINGQAPNPGERFSEVNGRVYNIAVNNNQICGHCFSSMIASIYSYYTAANLNTVNISDTKLTAGQNALNRGSLNSLINEYADACEQIVCTNTSFCTVFGDCFHRDPVILPLSSNCRKRNRGPTSSSTPEPEPEPAPPVKKIATRGGRKGKGRTSTKKTVQYNYI
ncbi:hypothetical protein BDV23DRAFT_167762 [Aspergillus alliaceus]|uniref:Uncharacterized protein n=1 Tax=Petromyces alliaceus TaxID=209559 RepID=A0A5N7BR45_PETAA|nr:hypothetical protein BDV23DRAFT_167762 [Aspergillus alliaceus]